jgi:Na+/H+-translocating membrane pyrophosphatase
MARLSLVLTVSALAAVAGLRLRASFDAGKAGEDGVVEASIVEATKAFARKTWGAAGAWLVGGAGLVVAAYGVLARPVADAASTRGSLAIAELVAFVLGGAGALAASEVALRLGARGEGASEGEKGGGIEASLRVSAAPALVSAAISTVAFGAALVVASFATGAAGGLERASFLAFAVAAHAFGACVGGAMAHVGGRVFSAGASAGARARAEDDPDPRNPAVVLERVANRLTDRSGLGAEVFELAALDLVAATIVASTAGLDARGGELAPLFFPVVARAFGLVAAFIGVMAVKSSATAASSAVSEEESPLDAVDRGSTVAAGLSAIGVLAAAWWLLRGAFVGVACAGVLGVLCAWVLVRVGRASRGTIAASAPTLFALLLVPSSWALGHVAGHRHGALGLAVASVGFLCASAFPLAASTLASRFALGDALADASSAMRVGVSRLVQAGSVLVAWVGVLAFLAVARPSGASSSHASDLGVIAPVAGVACAIGAAVAVGAAVLARRAAARVTQATEEEIARVLADVPTEDGRSVFPIDFHPAHDRAVAHVAADAHLHAATSILLAVGAPIVVGLVVRRGFGLGVEAIVALVFGATLVPLLFAPLSRALSPQENADDASNDSAPWMAFAARLAIAVALALAVIFS